MVGYPPMSAHNRTAFGGGKARPTGGYPESAASDREHRRTLGRLPVEA
jgi:hypothetical protein